MDTLELARKLIADNSVSPNDGQCQQIIAHLLSASGFNCQHLPFEDVSNLWATHGSGSPCLVFAGHTDVVPPGDNAAWTTPPFSPVIKDGYLYGRGAVDMKGSLAAMVTAAAAATRAAVVAASAAAAEATAAATAANNGGAAGAALGGRGPGEGRCGPRCGAGAGGCVGPFGGVGGSGGAWHRRGV